MQNGRSPAWAMLPAESGECNENPLETRLRIMKIMRVNLFVLSWMSKSKKSNSSQGGGFALLTRPQAGVGPPSLFLLSSAIPKKNKKSCLFLTPNYD